MRLGLYSELRIPTCSESTSSKEFKVRMRFSSKCRRVKVHKLAYLIHIDCWRLLTRSKTNQTNIATIYKFAQSTSPLFGIRHSTNDDMASIGDETGGWKGIVYGDSLRNIYLIKDDFKYLRIGFSKTARPARVPKDLGMWDKDLGFSSTHSHLVFDVIRQPLRFVILKDGDCINIFLSSTAKATFRV
ncbi:hypothetical protein F5884DRAFT_759287 [Xylogone sp. PMI_703]|nr:hypothetical protein F5884DRAFT_759287 [Xylogone sp. PMI_703]